MQNQNKTPNTEIVNPKNREVGDVESVKIVEEYIKPKRQRKIITKNKKYSSQKRNREDLLESSIVKERLNKISENKTNNNYGTYTT